MSDYYSKVKDFHTAFGLKIGDTQKPGFTDTDSRNLRVTLLNEEISEYIESELENDFVNVAKELSDILYIVCGTAIEYGIPLDAVFHAVHESNMAKLVLGKPLYRKDGKVAKPKDWQPPDIAFVLNPKIDPSHYMTQTQFDSIKIGDIVNHVLNPWTTYIVVGTATDSGGWYVVHVNTNGTSEHLRMSDRKEWFLQSRVTGRVSNG